MRFALMFKTDVLGTSQEGHPPDVIWDPYETSLVVFFKNLKL